jgi:hypothetical protein
MEANPSTPSSDICARRWPPWGEIAPSWLRFPTPRSSRGSPAAWIPDIPWCCGACWTPRGPGIARDTKDLLSALSVRYDACVTRSPTSSRSWSATSPSAGERRCWGSDSRRPDGTPRIPGPPPGKGSRKDMRSVYLLCYRELLAECERILVQCQSRCDHLDELASKQWLERPMDNGRAHGRLPGRRPARIRNRTHEGMAILPEQARERRPSAPRSPAPGKSSRHPAARPAPFGRPSLGDRPGRMASRDSPAA